jgi:hypothetical protein
MHLIRQLNISVRWFKDISMFSCIFQLLHLPSSIEMHFGLRVNAGESWTLNTDSTTMHNVFTTFSCMSVNSLTVLTELHWISSLFCTFYAIIPGSASFRKTAFRVSIAMVCILFLEHRGKLRLSLRIDNVCLCTHTKDWQLCHSLNIFRDKECQGANPLFEQVQNRIDEHL